MNALLTAIVADVYSLSNRPDLIAETSVAVKAATLKAHQREYYEKDLFESGVAFPSSLFVQQLTYKSLVPLWRSLKYLRKFDPTTPSLTDGSLGSAGAEFDLITADNILDSYKIEKTDVMYMAGLNLNIKSSTAFQYALMGCYTHPDITDAGYNSWIAQEHKYAIVFEAVRVVFKTIGFDEQSAGYEELVKEQYAAVDTSQILGKGY